MSTYYARALALREGKAELPPRQRELVARLRTGFGIEALYVDIDVTSARGRQFLEIIVPTLADAERCKGLGERDRITDLFVEVLRALPDDLDSAFRLVPPGWLTKPEVRFVSLERYAALCALGRLREANPAFLDTIRARFPSCISAIDEMGPLHFAVFVKGPVGHGIADAFLELLSPHAPPGWITSAALDLEFPDAGGSALDFYR